MDKPKGIDWEPIHACLVLALLVHALVLMAYAIRTQRPAETSIRLVAKVDVVDRIAVPEKVKPAPLKLPQVPRLAPNAPGRSAAAPAPTGKPRDDRAPRAGPPARTQGDPYPTSAGRGLIPKPGGGAGGSSPDEGLGGGGTGGSGTGGTGSGGDGSGGDGGGGGAPAKPAGKAVMSVSMYNSYAELGIPQPDRENSGGARSWQELCSRIGLDYEELRRRDRVPPFFTGAGHPTLDQNQRLRGQSGMVTVRSRISPEGAPSARIEQSSGNPLMDEVGLFIANHTSWLPGLRRGEPAEMEIVYGIQFSEVP